jgi:hypothetical protein
MRQLKSLFVEFGMTPTSRTRLSVQPEAKPLDPFEAFLMDSPVPEDTSA